MSTFNKADVLRVLRDRETKLQRRRHDAIEKFNNVNGSDYLYGPEVKAIKTELRVRWAAVLGNVIRPGLEVGGVRVRNAGKLAAAFARHLVTNDRYCRDEFEKSWNWLATPGIIQARRRHNAARAELVGRYEKALAALSKLREEVSLAGVPADIVKKLNAIDKMLK